MEPGEIPAFEQPAEPIDFPPLVINPAPEMAADPQVDEAVAIIMEMENMV